MPSSPAIPAFPAPASASAVPSAPAIPASPAPASASPSSPAPASPAAALARLLAAPADDVPAFRTFLDTLTPLPPDEVARRLAFPDLLAALDAELRAPAWPPTAGVRASDLVQVAEMLDHLLRPLAVDPGPAPIYHASSNGLAALVCMLARRRHGGRFLLTEHGIYLRERYIELRRSAMARPAKALLLRFHRLVTAAAYAEAAAIAPGSDWNQRWEARHGAPPERLRTIYNGIDPSEFPARTGEPPAPVVSWLGRVDPLKDLDTLIRAFAVVHGKRPDARLRLYGRTPAGNEDHRAALSSLIGSLGLEGVVTFEGGVARSADAYRDAQVAVLSSISEGFPYSLIEAMACGVPAVATGVGGVPEAVADTGVVVLPRAPDLLGSALVSLLDDGSRRRRLGPLARERVLARFTLGACLEGYRALYSELLSGAEPARSVAPVAPVAPGAPAPPVAPAPPRAGAGGVAAAAAALPRSEVDALLAAAGGRDAVAMAVDVDEVAATFESVGLTDQVAVERFGAADVFALAAIARHAATAPAADAQGEGEGEGAGAEPEQRAAVAARPPVVLPSTKGALARGLTYVLPAVVVAAASLGGAHQGALVAASSLGWGLAQGGGVLAFTVLHRTGGPAGGGRQQQRPGLAPLRRAIALTVAGILAAGVGVGAATDTAVGVAFALPLLHLVGSAALVMAGRYVSVLALVSPVSLLSVAGLVRPRSPSTMLVGPASIATVAATLGLVAWVARGSASAPGRGSGGRTLEPVDWIRSLPLVGCGWVTAAFALLAVSATSDVPGLDDVDSRQWLLLGLPLWVTVAGGEWLLVRVRRSLRALLEASATVPVFRRAGRWTVVRWLEATVVALQGAVWVAAGVSDLAPNAAWRAASVFFLVGVALVGVTVLTVVSRVGAVAGVLGVAVVGLAFVATTRRNPWGVADHSAALCVCAVAAAVLGVLAVRALVDPVSQR